MPGVPANQKSFRTFIGPTKAFPKFIPYESETDVSDSEESMSTTSGSTDSTDTQANFAQFASNLQLSEAAGQDLTTSQAQIELRKAEAKGDINYASYNEAFNIVLPFDKNDIKGSDIWKNDKAVETKQITSIIMLNSRDRDRSVYPDPVQLTLRLPRVYNNIASLQIVQMKLLSSFYYFRPDKYNLSIRINEFGRVNFDYAGNTLGTLNITNSIRQGTYNINTLLTEINTQLNTPPIFYDYPGGFNQFVPLFVSTGDFGINFNYPGDYFYDSLNRQYVTSPTRVYITTRYWQSSTLGFTPTLKQTKVAYYYPLLREYVLDPDYGIAKLVITSSVSSSVLANETVYSRIVYTFQGVSDAVIQQIIDSNINALDRYRSAHSFRQALINKYTAQYDTFNNRINIQSPSLSTSLVNLLTTQYNIFFAQQLTAYGITAAQYSLLQTLNSQLLSIINSMYEYIQTQFAVSYGINFNTYASVYFTQPNNFLNIQNAQNAIGVSSNYDLNVVKNNNEAITKNIIEAVRKDPTNYWPGMCNLPLDPQLGLQGYPTNLGASNSAPFLGGSNYPFNTTTSNFDFSKPFINSNGDINIDLRRKAGDILCPIDAAHYTVFRFRSLYRQTLQVETLPRPTIYRYPAYNVGKFTNQIQAFFDNSYSYVYSASNAKMDNVPIGSINTIYGFNNPSPYTSNYGVDLAGSLALWNTNNIAFDVRNNQYNFVFYLPFPEYPKVAPAYKHPMTLTAVPYNNTNFVADMKLFLYHDRAGFMADLSGNARNETPLFYKESISIASNATRGDLTFTAYAGNTYYAILRSSNVSFRSLQAQLAPWYPNRSAYTPLTDTLASFDPLADPLLNLNNLNYAKVADPDFIRLPITSNLFVTDPTGNEVNTGLVISNVPIGYDTNGVSTDLTDYVGFLPNNTTQNIYPPSFVRVDPISGYFFQAGSSYSTSNQSYFYTGAQNFLLTPANQNSYTPLTVAAREYKIVHWYDTTYIPDPSGLSNTYNSITDLTPNINPYTLTTTNSAIPNYLYDLSNNAIQLGYGPCGFTFAPDDGIWSIERVMFRSAFIANDLNSNIRFLGVYLTSYVNAIPISQLSLTQAVAKLDFYKKTAYSSQGSVNFGFDSLLGTYYEFKKDSTFTQVNLTGFSQNSAVFTDNANNFYSVIPFDSKSNVVFTRALVGSPTPYPYVCDASASSFYFDGLSPPTGQGVVVPKPPTSSNSAVGPPAGVSYTLSKYEQSIPIGTQILHYQDKKNIVQDVSGFVQWTDIGYIPTQMYADVSGVMMVQSTDFKFYSYPYNTVDRTFSFQFSLEVDDIFPAYENTTLVGAAGNTTSYAFLGFQVSGSSFQIRIKIYNVAEGTLTDLNLSATYQIPDLGFSVNSFSITDINGFVISGSSGTGVATTYRTPQPGSTLYTDTFTGFVTVKSYQPPSGSTVYSLPFTSSGNSSNYYYTIGKSSTTKNKCTITSGPSTYTNFLVTHIPSSIDQILFLSSNAPTYFYKVTQITGTSPNYSVQVVKSAFSFQSAPIGFVPGALGAKWVILNDTPCIWGNRNDEQDAPNMVQNAWQVFYPTTKVVLRKIANAVNPIIDLSGLTYPEWPHTSMFVYNTIEGFRRDISNSTVPKWGIESSGGSFPSNAYNWNTNGFMVSDSKMSGYNFNSYIFNVPLLPNLPQQPYYYLAVRSFTPSEKSQVLLRFNMPQRYDFGFVRLRDLSNEPMLALSNGSLFNPTYYTALIQFNSNFVLSNYNFGYNATQNISGSNITSTGFGDFLRQYTSLYSVYSSNVAIINSITNNVNSNIQSFINTNLTYIIPDYAKTRQAFTEPITFSILWKSALTPTYLAAEDEWGLGWNLGFSKADTDYATIQRADSFFKILDDYIFLKLNPEYDMNRIDFGAKENLSLTMESQGQIRGYNGKLLLNTFGNYAQTIIQNPVYFNPTLSRLDKMSFQWIDTVGNPLVNAECEWNAAIQIVEEVPVSKVQAGNPLIIPTS
jgi:hypothetical protein